MLLAPFAKGASRVADWLLVVMPMPLVRLSVRDADVSMLDAALTYALTTWTADLRRGEPARWEQFAVETHATRHTLRTTASIAECRRLVLMGDVAGALRAVADACEAADASLAATAPLLRRYAAEVTGSEPGHSGRVS